MILPAADVSDLFQILIFVLVFLVPVFRPLVNRLSGSRKRRESEPPVEEGEEEAREETSFPWEEPGPVADAWAGLPEASAPSAPPVPELVIYEVEEKPPPPPKLSPAPEPAPVSAAPVPREPESAEVPFLSGIDALSPWARAVVIAEVLGPCRSLRPLRR